MVVKLTMDIGDLTETGLDGEFHSCLSFDI